MVEADTSPFEGAGRITHADKQQLVVAGAVAEYHGAAIKDSANLFQPYHLAVEGAAAFEIAYVKYNMS